MVRLLLPQARYAGPLHEPDPDHGGGADVRSGARDRGDCLRAWPRYRRRDDAGQSPGAGARHRAPSGGRRAAGRGRAHLEAERARQHPQRLRPSLQRGAPGRADRHAAALPRRHRAVRRQPRVLRSAAQVQHLPQRHGRALGALLDPGPELRGLSGRPRGPVPGAGGRHARAEPAPGVAPAGTGPPGSGGGGDGRAARPVSRPGLPREAAPGAPALPGRADRHRCRQGLGRGAGAVASLAGPAGAGAGGPQRRSGRLVSTSAARPLDHGPLCPARPAELAAARGAGGTGEALGRRATADDARAGARGHRHPGRLPGRGGHRCRRGRAQHARRYAGPQHGGVHGDAVLQHRGDRDQGRDAPPGRDAAATHTRPARNPYPHERLPVELRPALHGGHRPEGRSGAAADRHPGGLRRSTPAPGAAWTRPATTSRTIRRSSKRETST